MTIQFSETMSGTAVVAGCPRGFSFTVTAAGPSFLGAWGRDALTLTGMASLEEVVQDAPLLPGSLLEIGLPFRRRLRYSVVFVDPAGHTYRFFGEKRIRYLLLPLTLRRLGGTLFVDGTALGPAELYFRYRTLPAFLASFRLRGGEGRSAAGGGAAEAGA